MASSTQQLTSVADQDRFEVHRTILAGGPSLSNRCHRKKYRCIALIFTFVALLTARVTLQSMPSKSSTAPLPNASEINAAIPSALDNMYGEEVGINSLEIVIRRQCNLDVKQLCYSRSIRLKSSCVSPVGTIDPAFASIMASYSNSFNNCRFKFHIYNIDASNNDLVNQAMDLVFRHFLEDLYILARVNDLLPGSPSSQPNPFGSDTGSPASSSSSSSSIEIHQIVTNFMQSLAEYLDRSQTRFYLPEEHLKIVIQEKYRDNQKGAAVPPQQTVSLTLDKGWSAFELDRSFRNAMEHYRYTGSRNPNNLVDIPTLLDDSTLTISAREYVSTFDGVFLPLIRKALNDWTTQYDEVDSSSSWNGVTRKQHKELPQFLEPVAYADELNHCLWQRYFDEELITDKCHAAIYFGAQRLDEFAENRANRYVQNKKAAQYHRRAAKVMLFVSLAIIALLLIRLGVRRRCGSDSKHYSSLDQKLATGRQYGESQRPILAFGNEKKPVNVIFHLDNSSQLLSEAASAQYLILAQWSIALGVGLISLARDQSWTTLQCHHFWIDISLLCCLGLLAVLWWQHISSTADHHRSSPLPQSPPLEYEMSTLVENKDGNEIGLGGNPAADE